MSQDPDFDLGFDITPEHETFMNGMLDLERRLASLIDQAGNHAVGVFTDVENTTNRKVAKGIESVHSTLERVNSTGDELYGKLVNGVAPRIAEVMIQSESLPERMSTYQGKDEARKVFTNLGPSPIEQALEIDAPAPGPPQCPDPNQVWDESLGRCVCKPGYVWNHTSNLPDICYCGVVLLEEVPEGVQTLDMSLY